MNLRAFKRIGGKQLSRKSLPVIQIQTDASCYAKGFPVARMAVWWELHAYSEVWQTPSITKSTEAEWLSVLLGLRMCVEESKREPSAICIENDNLSVIAEYSRFYCAELLRGDTGISRRDRMDGSPMDTPSI